MVPPITKTDPRYERAAKRWIEVPQLKCPEVMKISGFSETEAKDNTICQRVRRMKKGLEDKIEKGIIPPIIEATAKLNNRTLSPLTEETDTSASKNEGSSCSSKEFHKKLGVKQIRKTSVQAQQKRVNDKKIIDNEKRAFKKATIMYNKEKEKVNGLSAKRCAETINKIYGSNITQHQRKYKKTC